MKTPPAPLNPTLVDLTILYALLGRRLAKAEREIARLLRRVAALEASPDKPEENKP